MVYHHIMIHDIGDWSIVVLRLEERERSAKVSHMDATNVIRPNAKTFVCLLFIIIIIIQCVYVRYEKIYYL